MQLERSIDSLKTKWKNIKATARRRKQILQKSQLKTGGEQLKPAEKRILDSPLYADIVIKLGISCDGNEPRLDSDSTMDSFVLPPTNRLTRALATSQNEDDAAEDEDTRMSGLISGNADDSNFSFANASQQSMDDSNLNSIENSIQAPSQLFQNQILSTPSTSTANDSSSTIPQNKKKSTKRFDTSDVLAEHLNQQMECNEVQKKYLESQLKRSEIEKERSVLLKRLAEIEVQKAEMMFQIDIDKHRELARLEIEAKRHELNFTAE